MVKVKMNKSESEVTASCSETLRAIFRVFPKLFRLQMAPKLRIKSQQKGQLSKNTYVAYENSC